MKFTHDFAADLEALDFFADDPWALVRFADGEAAVMRGTFIKTADGWRVDPTNNPFRLALVKSLQTLEEDYYIGVSCPCCDPMNCGMYSDELRKRPDDTITFSNLFCNGNYDRFRERALTEHFGHRCVVIGSGDKAHYDVPSNLVNHPEAMQIIDRLVAQLYDETKTILVAAGPASNVIIHRYWTTCPPEKRRVICDIGSALDPWMHGRMTRGYHDPDHPNRKKVCVWTT